MQKKFFRTTGKKGITLDVTYDFSDNIISFHDVYWQRVDILPLNRLTCSIKVKLHYYLHADGYVNDPNVAQVSYGIGDDSTTQPSWIVIDRADDPTGETITGDINIEVADGKFLFIRTILEEGQSSANLALTLQDGSIILPCSGTAVASGNPLVWSRT